MGSFISIIIPLYNKEKYIINTLNSIKNQTYKNYEIIIIDDGSTDNSIKIINNYSKINPNINFKIIRQSNNGVSSARNKGIKNAIGEYIFFIDGDDIIDKNCLKKLVENIQKNNVDMVVCGYKILRDGEIIEKSDDVEINKYISKHFLMKLIKRDICIYMGNALYKRTIIEKNNIKFNSKYKYAEDKIFIYNYILNCANIYLEKNRYFTYLYNESSVTMKCDEEMLTSAQIFDDFYNYVRLNHLEGNEDLLRLLKEYRIPEEILLACDVLISLKCSKSMFKFICKENGNLLKKMNCYSIRYGKKMYFKMKLLIYSPATYFNIINIKNKLKK